jgi:ribonucleoside-diphosphate reductase alpha chain
MPNMHHGIAITDAFMEAVRNLQMWDLIDPKSGLVVESVDAFDLWIDILECRKTETGEPFLLFIDTVNRYKPDEYKALGLAVSSSNICTEITIYTDKDTTAVCCLASKNLEYWYEYEPILEQFTADISDYLDNVLKVFLEETSKFTGMKAEAFKRVRKSVIESRDIGIGAMGLHSLYQKKNIPFESPMAKALNKRIFSSIREASDKHQEKICTDNPELICPMSRKAGTRRRNILTMAIAPTMGISNLMNLASSGIEPWVSNAFTKKLIQGSFAIRNKYLAKYIEDYYSDHLFEDPTTTASWINEQWSSIIKHGGSVLHLDWMSDYAKDVFKTAFEIDQRAIIGQAADRQVDIDQSQSLNIFLPAECSYEELHAIHFMMWELELKSAYYLRSEPETTADTSNKERKAITLEDDACVSCT